MLDDKVERDVFRTTLFTACCGCCRRVKEPRVLISEFTNYCVMRYQRLVFRGLFFYDNVIVAWDMRFNSFITSYDYEGGLCE